MKRLLYLAAFLFVGTGTASADFVLLKINLNQLNFLPTVPAMNLGGGAIGGKGGPGGAPFPGVPGGGMPPGGQGGAIGAKGGIPNPGLPSVTPGTPANLFPDDPNARYISALVEFTKLPQFPQMAPPFGAIFTGDTHYGNNVWLPYSTMFPMLVPPRIHADSLSLEFATKFNKEKKDKNIDTMLHLARWTLSRGNLRRFHEVMDEAGKLDEKHATVKQYLRVRKALEAPLKNQDPAQRELLDELTRTGYKEHLSKKGKGHYGIYAPSLDDPNLEAGVNRRLHLLEETLETFYLWFAMQKDLSKQPDLPKYRLIGIITGSNDDFISRHAQWGSMPRVADGFTPQRDNVIVMSAKSRVNDSNYADLNSLISTKLAQANTKLQEMGFKQTITRAGLLTGEINTIKESGRIAMFVGAAQTAVLLAKSIEDQAERHTVTHEGTRQLLIASGMFPRNVQVPDWIIEGLAAFFETPAGGAYPTIGDRSCVHLISFKHHRTNNPEFTNRTEVLQSVISDTYFQKAKQLNKELQDSRDQKDRRRLKESWEVARCTSWALIYYLSKKGKLDQIVNYGKELDKLPRDMDLSNAVMQGCFAKAFDMADPNYPQQIYHTKLNDTAQNWFDMMEITNLDNANLQAFLEKERAKEDPTPIVAAKDLGTSPNPAAPGVDLAGTYWAGTQLDMTGNPGNGQLTLNFTTGNNVTRTFARPPMVSSQGTWTLSGNSINIKFSDGSTYSGTINGKEMKGTTNLKEAVGWTVTQGTSPPAVNPAGPDLAGTTWGGKETVGGAGSALSFQFLANGQVTMTSKSGTVQGKYEQQATAVSISFKDANIYYNGNISGATLQGNARSGGTIWSWNVVYGAQPQVNPMPPNPMPPPMPPPKKGPRGKG